MVSRAAPAASQFVSCMGIMTFKQLQMEMMLVRGDEKRVGGQQGLESRIEENSLLHL